ncbi:M20 family metallopeptidase [Planomicrobium sp. CPCC 101110]|uniref:M20 family metallopeptidase n=1 Tax=Planomicrobium sp. CPCC 101110 TaxID=2599619 RepID=UPI0011B4727F|nr:ArgE/DapE family deacylase [Planomicrobium sp. CPCC 101110]TWT25355.1 ArgE/DapE family deacylase [Planomicrobium sp. CPCC 101110]
MDNAIVQTVDKLKPDAVKFLQQMIQIPSENPMGDYEDLSRFLNDQFTAWGFEVEVVNVPDEEVKQAGLKTPRKNVIATIKGEKEGPHLLFNAHLDTVPAGDPDHWTYPPFSGGIAGGKVYGRGATDSKGRLAAYTMAALALKNSNIPFSGKVSIVATCDEETGGALGAGYVTNNKLVRGDMVIVEGYSNQIVRAMAGVLQLKIQVEGVPAHAAFKWKGLNAIGKMAKVIQGLEELQQSLEKEPSSIEGMKYTTVNVGVIEGGTKINVVPGNCQIEVDFRVIPEHTLDEIYNRVMAMIESLKEEDSKLKVKVDRISSFETNPTVTGEDSPLIAQIQEANKEVTGKVLPVVGMLGQSDSRWFIQNGIPAINFGPGTNDNNLHGYDEFMDIDDLIQTTKVLAVLLKNYVGTQALMEDQV